MEAYGEVGTSDNCFHEQGYGGCSVDMHEGTGGGGGGGADGGGVRLRVGVSEAIRCWHFAERSFPPRSATAAAAAARRQR